MAMPTTTIAPTKARSQYLIGLLPELLIPGQERAGLSPGGIRHADEFVRRCPHQSVRHSDSRLLPKGIASNHPGAPRACLARSKVKTPSTPSGRCSTCG